MIVTEQNPLPLTSCSGTAMSHLLRRSLIDSPWQDRHRIDLASLGPLHLATAEKTFFLMATPEVLSLLEKHNFKSLFFMSIKVRCPRG